jgi:small subunit ribosomal protein S6
MPKSATSLYELMLVFQPDLLETAKDKKLREFEKFLEENGGKVKMKDDWGKRKLAYRIGKFDTGIYVVFNLILPPSFNKELDEHMRIDKDMIRFLLTALEDDYTYTKFDEEKKMEPKPETPGMSRKTSGVSHKASTGAVTTDVKDKGKKASTESLDEKLGKLLEGGDLNM